MATITTSDELRLHNRSRVLFCLRHNGTQSRTFIGESTGLSAATVTQITADLIEDGVIEQVTPAVISDDNVVNTRRGRPQVMLQLNADAATTAVLTLLLNEIEVTLYDYSGNRIHRSKKNLITANLTLSKLKSHLFKALDSTLAAANVSASPLRHIACVCQGTVTRDYSSLLWSPITKLRNVELRSILQDRYGVSVTVSNDCKIIAGAIDQERQAAASAQLSTTEGKSFAVILSSYGIGLGYFHQGNILTGSHSSGTEFGHMLFKAEGALCRCGRRGCIEAYSSDYAIWRRANRLPLDAAPLDSIPTDEFAKIIEAAKCGPGDEREAFEEAGAAFGQGLSNLFVLFDPFPVMLVGISQDAFELMRPSLLRTLEHYGVAGNKNYVSVYERSSEKTLISLGASLQSLSYLDKEIFSFGETFTENSAMPS